MSRRNLAIAAPRGAPPALTLNQPHGVSSHRKWCEFTLCQCEMVCVWCVSSVVWCVLVCAGVFGGLVWFGVCGVSAGFSSVPVAPRGGADRTRATVGPLRSPSPQPKPALCLLGHCSCPAPLPGATGALLKAADTPHTPNQTKPPNTPPHTNTHQTTPDTHQTHTISHHFRCELTPRRCELTPRGWFSVNAGGALAFVYTDSMPQCACRCGFKVPRGSVVGGSLEGGR